jgi:hypothetical protein
VIQSRMMGLKVIRQVILLVVLSGLASGCAKVEYVGNTSKGFWSDSSSKVGPNDAYREAEPHLAATWEARCKELPDHEGWCEKPPIDHMVRSGKYYYLTRTSFPYEKGSPAYLDYAVRVDAESGEVIPYK